MFQAQQQIGPYILVRLLGKGGFGEVWLAEKRSQLLTSQVAVKLPLEADPDLDAVRREAQIWLQASGHPNVLPVIDADIYAGQVVIVSEYASGGSLAGWLKQNGGKAPSIEAAVVMTMSILAGLQHLHTLQPQPVIHRDLSPDNVLLQAGIPRLTDFGLSRVLKSEALTTGAGKRPYMPPEAYDGSYSVRSDLWAVGVMLYQMLDGHLPFPQKDPTSLFGAIKQLPPAPLPAETPPALQAVVARALEKDPSRRFASAVEMQTALRPTPPLLLKDAPPEPETTKPDSDLTEPPLGRKDAPPEVEAKKPESDGTHPPLVQKDASFTPQVDYKIIRDRERDAEIVKQMAWLGGTALVLWGLKTIYTDEAPQAGLLMAVGKHLHEFILAGLLGAFIGAGLGCVINFLRHFGSR